MAKAVSAHLANRGLGELEVGPVLFFSHPGVHLDPVRPAVRIVLSDALERLAVTIQQRPVNLDSEDVRSIVEALTKPPEAEAAPEPDKDPARKAVSQFEPKLSHELDKVSRKVNFSTRQWVLLGAIALLNILIIIGFIIFILSTT
jgi:hypothetical protein